MQLVIHSPFGARVNRAWGLALRKRLKASYTSAAVQGFGFEDFILEGFALAGIFATGAGPGVAAAFLWGFPAGSLDLAWEPRMIFAMIRVY